MFLWGTLSPLAAKGEIIDSKNIIGKVEYPGHQKPPIILQVPTKAENAKSFQSKRLMMERGMNHNVHNLEYLFSWTEQDAEI